jgi:hypothetical protein
LSFARARPADADALEAAARRLRARLRELGRTEASD